MPDPKPLADFIRALRAAEVRISVAEAIEAHQVAATIGYRDRGLLRDALGLTVAKTVAEKTRFESVFERFFDRQMPTADGRQDDSQSAKERPADHPEAADMPALAEMLLSGDQSQLAAAMEAAAAAIGVGNIQSFMQRGILGRRMLEEMGLRDVEQMISALNAAPDQGGGGMATALEAGRQQLLSDARAFVERQFQLHGRPASEQLREQFLESRSLASIDRRDMARANALVRRMARKLASRHLRRQHRARRGQLDVRRTLRVNMAHDAVPFQTVWKQRKVDKPKIVVICDVSRSVAAAAQFLLMFLYNLNDVIADIRAFAFSSHLIDVGDILDDHGVDEAIPKVLEVIGFRPTDYGQALVDLNKQHADAIDRRTTVIVLGDGRSNYANPRVDLLRQVHDRAQRLVWLNTEPESYWGLGDSEMLRYRPFCHVARTCATLRDLERVIDEVLRAGKS